MSVARQRWQAVRVPVAVGLLVVVAALVTVLATAAPSGRLDPGAAGPDGARALARVVEGLGAEVVGVTSGQDARTALDGAAGVAVLVVVRTELLSSAALDVLTDRPPDVPLVLVEPTEEALDALVPGVTAAAPVAEQALPPGCDLAAARRAGVTHAGGGRFRLSPAAAPGTACYARGGLPSLVQLQPAGAAPVTLLGSGELLTNEGLDTEGDAALALGLVEGADTVVWLLPDPLADPGPASGASSLSELLPPAVGLGLLQVVVAVVLLALARARRLGAPVVEPLPVVVRAAEVVQGRGRLYRAGRARDVAAAALREGARARTLPLLGLPAGSPRDELVPAVAGRTGDDTRRVDALLYGAPPSDDTALCALADALDDLGRRLRPAPPAGPPTTRATEGPHP